MTEVNKDSINGLSRFFSHINSLNKSNRALLFGPEDFWYYDFPNPFH